MRTRLITVGTAVAVLVGATSASAATNSVDVQYDQANCTAAITVGLGQYLDPRLEWFQTLDDHRVGSVLTTTPFFTDSPHSEPIRLIVPRDGKTHRVWVHADLRDASGHKIGEGARTTELNCRPLLPPPSPPTPPTPPAPPLPPHVTPPPSPHPCIPARAHLRIWTNPSPAPHGGWVWVNVRAPKGTRHVRIVVGTRRTHFRLHRAGHRRWTVRMGTWQFGPPYPGMVTVRTVARQRVCGHVRTVVRVVHRRQLDP